MFVPNDNPASAIQRLAPEILSEIFLQFREDEFCSMRSLSRGPLLPGRVCRDWRLISHSTPALWSHLTIGDFSHQKPKPEYAKDVEAMNLWIERSRSHPLSITIHLPPSTFRTGRSEINDKSLETLLVTVTSLSSRWRSIDGTMPSNFHDLVTAPFWVENVALLEHFGVRLWKSSGNGRRMTAQQFMLSSAQRLRYVETSANIHLTFHGPIHHIKYLIFLPGYRVKTCQEDLVNCLIQCPYLRTLSYHLYCTSRRQVFPAVLKPTRLRSLGLYIHSGMDLAPLFALLLVPELTDLKLEMDESFEMDRSSHDWPHLLNVLKRSRPPLVSLTLDNIPMKEQTLIDCLTFTPELREFTFYDMDCTDLTLGILTVDDRTTDPSKIVCPRLQMLNAGIESRFSNAAMKLMIISRWRGGSSIPLSPGKELDQVWYTNPDPDEMLADPAVAKCIQEGFWLDVTVR